MPCRNDAGRDKDRAGMAARNGMASCPASCRVLIRCLWRPPVSPGSGMLGFLPDAAAHPDCGEHRCQDATAIRARCRNPSAAQFRVAWRSRPARFADIRIEPQPGPAAILQTGDRNG